jgi:hypothetical protein
VLSEHCVSLVGPHIEQTFILAKAACDIVSSFVHIALVDFGKLGVIADQQQCGSDANDGSY